MNYEQVRHFVSPTGAAMNQLSAQNVTPHAAPSHFMVDKQPNHPKLHRIDP